MRSGRTIAGGLMLAAAAVLLAFVTRSAGAGLVLGIACGLGIALALRGTADADGPAATGTAPEEDGPGLDALLGAVGDPLLLVEGGRVAHANAAAMATLGPHIIDEDVRLAIRHPAATELLARARAPDGASIDLTGLGERDRHWTLSVRDLPGDRRLVRLADRTENRAAERMRVDFVANASHELRTPLASLIGFIETLEDANGPDDATLRTRFLGIMASEARRMQRLVDDLISLSRIEADRFRAPEDAVSLPAVTREVADALANQRGGRERIGIEAGVDLPDVAGDRAQLSQLVSNLIGNALKYGDPAKPVRVAMAIGPAGMVRLVVSDEGEGIAARHLPRLTERFYRADPSRSRAGGGTGLGLAIVKHIVERHRGRLDIASTQGVGTRVTVLLPVARTLAPHVRSDAA